MMRNKVTDIKLYWIKATGTYCWKFSLACISLGLTSLWHKLIHISIDVQISMANGLYLPNYLKRFRVSWGAGYKISIILFLFSYLAP